MKAKHVWPSILLVSLLAGVGCRFVPIQTARTTQIESFTMFFTFLKGINDSQVFYPEGSDVFYSDTKDTRLLRDVRTIDNVFKGLIGSKNWQNLKDNHGFGAVLDDFTHNRIVLDGTTTYILRVHPTAHERFIVEGTGRFFVRSTTTDAILLSGDLLISPQEFPVSALRVPGHLVLDVRIFVASIAKADTFHHHTDLKYQVYFHTNSMQRNFAVIDYAKDHRVYRDSVNTNNEIARLRYNSGDTTKLIDLRLLKHLKNDYN